MKKLKKFLAMMISMGMVLSMATVGFATTGGTGSLTVQLTGENKLDSGKSHTVKLYKLLNIDSYSGDKYSYSLNGDYTEAIKKALKKESISNDEIIAEIGKINGSSNPTTQQFANALEAQGISTNIEGKITSGNNSVTINNLEAGYYLIVLSSNPTTQQFANALEAQGISTNIEGKITSGNNSVTINNLEAGYYLIVLDNAKAIQATLKNVVNDNNGTVTLKEEAPSITKKGFDKNNKPVTDVQIGDIVTYTITTTIPKKDNNGTVTLKEEAPSITKKGFDKNNKPVTDVQIGDIVTYTITTTIPKKLSDTMVYKITDILSEGLDFVDFDSEDTPKNTQSLVIETELDKVDTTGITASVEGRTMTIELAQYIKDHQSDIGKTLTIKYKAKVNANAVVTEKNSAKLEYGKDSQNTIVNKPEEVKTPTFPVHIKKTDEGETSFLEGAEFELYHDNGSGTAATGTAIKVTGVKTPTFPVHIKKTDEGETSFLEGAEFELYHDNGSGTAATGTAIKVTGDSGVYKIHTDQSAEINETVKTKMVTVKEITTDNFDKNGGYNLVINGLKAGTYWLKETKAPDGYNLLKNDIKITVKNNKDGSYKNGGYNLVINGLKAGTYWLKETKAPDGYNLLKNDIKITVKNNKDGSYEISKDDTKAENNIVKIVNTPGSQLPETGGTGTLLLTAVGALLVAVAMIRFMRRKQEN